RLAGKLLALRLWTFQTAEVAGWRVGRRRTHGRCSRWCTAVPPPAARDVGPTRERPHRAGGARAAARRPAFYPHRPASVEHVQTHISHVFLAGPYAYKLKKPVRFPFLDASTPARRRTLGEAERPLNWRLAAPVSLCVLPITRERDGRFALDGRGPAVDRVVW